MFEETQAESYRMLRTGLTSGSGTAASVKQRKRRRKEKRLMGTKESGDGKQTMKIARWFRSS